MTTSSRTITIVEALRDRAGWTHSYLAERSGVRKSVLVQHEHDGTPLAGGDVQRLAVAFAVPFEALRGNAPIPGARPRLIDDNDPIVMKLLRAIDPDRHTVSDFDAARKAYYELLSRRDNGAEPVSEAVVLCFLEAARLLRTSGMQVETVMVIARAWQLRDGGA
jgi:transcriptional regulator with XRE-family HTH domain